MALIKELLKTSIFFDGCNIFVPICMEKSNFADNCFSKWLAVVGYANDKNNQRCIKRAFAYRCDLHSDWTCR
jgi:hypothetical protein